MTRRKLLASTFSDRTDKNNRPHILGYLGVSRLFPCASSDRILTNRRESISTRLTGAPVGAFLFIRVVNLNCSEVRDRSVLTGRHVVCDVSCNIVYAKLAWMYEFATERGAGNFRRSSRRRN
jgi:hypothetical protein